ncbi:MAG: UDP-glucose 6-dehydrogenase, partial [Burkholderiaceae bacterium]|nr:UDP-glucose 6-dehydrogenase [Burkholderiaceae bacterium]
MKVTVIGTGRVGLVTGACLADLGNDVLCLDVDAGNVALLQGGDIAIHEPGLKELVARNRADGRLTFNADVARAVAHGDIQIIAV